MPRKWQSITYVGAFRLSNRAQGKGAIPLARVYGGRKQNFVSNKHFRARGFYVSTVGRDEAAVRKYIREQEEEDKRLDQMGLW